MGQLKKRVLVGIVTYEGKDYIFDKCYKAVRAFNYDNFDVLIVDNSKSNKYSTIMKRRGYRRVVKIDRGKNSREALANSQNYIFNYAKEKDYDYVLFVESDLVPPRDTIKRLMGHGKRVVGSFYLLGTDYKYPCIAIEESAGDGTARTRYVGMPYEEGKKVRDPRETMEWFESGLRECAACGFGTTLIHKSIFSRYPVYNYNEQKTHHSDVWWYYTLRKDGVAVYVDTDVNVPHYPTDWSRIEDR